MRESEVQIGNSGGSIFSESKLTHDCMILAPRKCER